MEYAFRAVNVDKFIQNIFIIHWALIRSRYTQWYLHTLWGSFCFTCALLYFCMFFLMIYDINIRSFGHK